MPDNIFLYEFKHIFQFINRLIINSSGHYELVLGWVNSVMRVNRAEQSGKADKSGGSSNCVTHLETFAGHGNEARVLPRHGWGTIHGPRGIVPRNQSAASPSYFAYANAPRREEREREREKKNFGVNARRQKARRCLWKSLWDLSISILTSELLE